MAQQEPPLLEVIALDAADAVAAARGGADRLELVREIALAGLTPALRDFARIRESVAIPLRVMLRTNGGFTVAAPELEALVRETERLRRAGADQFVFGFLTGAGDLDLASIAALIAAVAPCPWTLHHAFDHASDARRAWAQAGPLPGVDNILTGGGRGDLATGLPTLVERAGWQTGAIRWLAGGQLQEAHIPSLRAAGITRFHAGRAARAERRWDRPVAEEAVRRIRRLIDAPA